MSILRIRKSGYTTPPAGPKRIDESEGIALEGQDVMPEPPIEMAAEGDVIVADTDPLCFLIESIRREKLRLVDQLEQCSRTGARLATLWAAVDLLHASVNRTKVCDAIADIVLNVIGGEQFALFEVHPRGACLNLVTSVGIDPTPFAEVGFG